VTVIQDTGGRVFGGFTPIHWKSSNCWISDPTRRSFLFSLTNPWGTGAMKFSLLKPEYAICCGTSCGPRFGGGCDIRVADNCNQNTTSYLNLGHRYANTTGRDGQTFFTGAHNFRVKEILVFELTV
jgi:hypothetical protein